MLTVLPPIYVLLKYTYMKIRIAENNFSRHLFIKCLLNIGCLCLVLMPAIMYAQAPKIKFKQIAIEQGLSNSWVEAIYQDSRGFMWFGTRDGLNRYDGNQIKVYRNAPKDTNSISDNFIQSITEDHDHNLWIGTTNGLNVFSPSKGVFTRYKHNTANPKSISANNVTRVYEDKKNNIWVTTREGGLNLFNKTTNTFYSFLHNPADKTSIGDNVANDIYEDTNGNLWIATESGLNLFDRQSKTFSSYRNQLDKDHNNICNVIRHLSGDKQGNLFLGTGNAGLIIFDIKQKTFKQLTHQLNNDASLSGDMTTSVFTDHEGNIWIGTVNEGLNLYDASNNSFTHYRHEPGNASSLNQRSASVIFEDRQGNLWVGTHRGGVSMYAPGANKFNLYRQEADIKSISYSDVKSFCEDKKGNIWIGTDGGGLNLFDRKKNTFLHYHYDPSNPKTLGSDAVLDITQDTDGNLWVGTWEGGLNLFDPATGTFTRYKNNPNDKTSISSSFVQKIFQDHTGNLWIGTYYGGLNLLNTKTHKFTRIIKDPDGITSFYGNNVVAINEDKAGNLWIGTDDGALNCYNLKTKRFSHYFNNEEKSPDFRVLFTDSKGRVWAGQKGLYLFNPSLNKFALFTDKAGLADEFIKGITEDGQGNLWVSTTNGVARMNPDAGTFKKFNVADGLQGSEFEANAFLKTADGEMFFGGNTGLNTFYPADIKTNQFSPPVYITGFQIFTKNITAGENSPLKNDISLTNTITLTYRQSSISFDFAALNYVIPENNQYAYKLEGLDSDWVYAGNIRKASYTNLDAGTYIFHVKAANNDGIWNEAGASVKIIITPPFWLTWWFKTLAILIVIGGIYAYYHQRINNIKRQKNELETQVKERTAVVLNQVEELKAQSEELSEQAAHLKELNEQLEKQKEQELEKAIAQNKFEIASEVLHDVGNALVGFGSYVTRINRTLEQNNVDNAQNLAIFIKAQQSTIATVIGADKAAALVVISEGIAKSQKINKEEIRNSANELFNIITHIEQILSIQRQYVKAREGLHERKPVDLAEIINDCRAMLFASFDKKGIALSVNIGAGKHIIKGDQTKLMQVILNVFKNSIEAIGLESNRKSIAVHLQTFDHTTELTLTDSGCGFDAATGDRFFERGFTTKATGTGLGLYNCRSIVETHGGSFLIQSDGPGFGAVTTINFKDKNENHRNN